MPNLAGDGPIQIRENSGWEGWCVGEVGLRAFGGSQLVEVKVFVKDAEYGAASSEWRSAGDLECSSVFSSDTFDRSIWSGDAS